jgi:diguanylate cyclase (GGDEF)-like protein
MIRRIQRWLCCLPALIVARLGVARTSKLAGLGALVVVLLMIGIASVAVVRTETGIEAARSAAHKVVVADGLHQTVGREQAALDQLQAKHAGASEARFERTAAAAQLAIADAVPEVTDSPALRARMLRSQSSLHTAGRAVIASMRARRPGEARRLRLGRFAPAGLALHGALDEAEKNAVWHINRRLHDLERGNELVLTAMPVAFGLGLLVLAVMWGVGLEGRRREAELKLLEGQAKTDSLTGAGNRRAFREALDRPLLGDYDPLSRVSVALIDVVGLKHVNDTCGHNVGDERLKLVADCLRRLTPGEQLFRIGGDDFAVVLAGTGVWEAFEFIQSVHEQLGASPAPDPITVAAGVADAPAGADRDELLQHADLALIAAKAARRDTVVYTPDLQPSRERSASEAERRHAETIATALARAVDAKDSYTRSHSETVSALCGLIAETLGLGPDRMAALKLAGILHDVGKIGISDDILQKPGKLTEQEFDVMKEHSTIGHRIVMGAALEEQAEWILHHHERPDGRGYPDGLSGDEIPLESRIILVADAFEAITSDRPYRCGRPAGEALAELDRHAGTQFDTDCVRALRSVLTPDVASQNAVVAFATRPADRHPTMI